MMMDPKNSKEPSEGTKNNTNQGLDSKEVGRTIGTVVGGIVGAKVGGQKGAIVGGAVGGLVGGEVGEYVGSDVGQSQINEVKTQIAKTFEEHPELDR